MVEQWGLAAKDCRRLGWITREEFTRFVASMITRGDLGRTQAGRLVSSHLSAEDAAEKERQTMRSNLRRVGISEAEVVEQFDRFHAELGGSGGGAHGGSGGGGGGADADVASGTVAAAAASSISSAADVGPILPIRPALTQMMQAGVARRAEDDSMTRASESLKAAALDAKAKLRANLDAEEARRAVRARAGGDTAPAD